MSNKRFISQGLKLLLLAVLSLSLHSCKDNEELIKRKEYSEIEIQDLSENLKVGIPDVNFTKESKPFVIYTLWRKNKKKECVKFGICEWFPGLDFDLDNLPDRHVPCFFVKNDDDSLKPFIVELKEDVSNLPAEAYEFIVSEDIEINTEKEEALGFEKIIVKQGEYPYDKSIGLFGGYVIPLFGIK